MKPQKRRKIIQEKIKELKEKYEETKNLNESAWKSHGSELCPAEMQRNEEKILKEIEQHEGLLASPEMDMNDKLLKQKREEVLDKIAVMEIKEQELSEQKKEVRNYLILIKSIREIK